MSRLQEGAGTLDYFPCRYGTSRFLFRGPRRRLKGAYAIYLGGRETYGRFLPLPYPTLVEHATGLKSVNIGCTSIGIDAYLNDDSLLRIAQAARVAVIEVLGAHNLSNRYYSVHPRHNDRFIRPSDLLNEAFPDVDFTEFSFTRHLLTELEQKDPVAFGEVVQDLRATWLAKMTRLIRAVNCPVVLVWLARRPSASGSCTEDPMLVDRSLIEELRDVHACVEVTSEGGPAENPLQDLVFTPMERAAASEMMGFAAHQKTAELLAPILQGLAEESCPSRAGAA